MRKYNNAVLYLVDSGYKWRQLPHDFPTWQTVYSFFHRVNEKGLWDKILEHLVKTAYASEQIGFDGRKTKGRKRHIAINTRGCMLALKVHKANLHDTKAGIFIAIQAQRKYPTIKKFCGDRSYRGFFITNVKTILGLDVDTSAKIIPKGWKVVPKRWIVERIFAWLNNSR